MRLRNSSMAETPMAESQDKDWVNGNWDENLQSRFVWMRIWEIWKISSLQRN